MKANVFYMGDRSTRDEICNNLKGFGVEIFYRAKIIKELELLEKLNNDLENNKFDPLLNDFLLSYLVDVICITVFFENYLKATLISQGYFVNRINNIEGFKDLFNRQKKEPIYLTDIPNDNRYEIDLENEKVFHPAIKETTIGMNELLKKGYLEKYDLDNDIITFIRGLVYDRNKLHFYERPEFVFSKDKIEKLKRLKSFVANDIDSSPPSQWRKVNHYE